MDISINNKTINDYHLTLDIIKQKSRFLQNQCAKGAEQEALSYQEHARRP